MDGGRVGCSNREKGKRHVIICRSSTSPVNPQSRLTWLIKEAIKGPPPEILRERERQKQARDVERRPNGENERRERRRGIWEGRGEDCCDLFYCFTCQPPLCLESWTRLLHASPLYPVSFLPLASGPHAAIAPDLHPSANSCDLQHRGN